MLINTLEFGNILSNNKLRETLLWCQKYMFANIKFTIKNHKY
jgi:hypothetical protein